MGNVLLVFCFGGIGTLFRWLLLQVPFLQPNGFSWMLLVVNAIGSCLAGFFAHYLPTEKQAPVLIGFCGGFTSFSAFAADNFRLTQSGELLKLTLNIALQVIITFLAFAIGVGLAKKTV